MNAEQSGNKPNAKILVDCNACHGSGVYVGFGEKRGAAVVCKRCGGSGAVEYKPVEVKMFQGRKRRDDIKTVAVSQGYWLEPGRDPGEVSYDDFMAGKMPVEGLIKLTDETQ